MSDTFVISTLEISLPFVNLYISFTVSVAKDFKGSPLSPPASDLRKLCNEGGRLTVVLLTIIPSTLPCKTKTNEPRHYKTCLQEFPTRLDTNWPAQPQKLARFLKFRL